MVSSSSSKSFNDRLCCDKLALAELYVEHGTSSVWRTKMKMYRCNFARSTKLKARCIVRPKAVGLSVQMGTNVFAAGQIQCLCC